MYLEFTIFTFLVKIVLFPANFNRQRRPPTAARPRRPPDPHAPSTRWSPQPTAHRPRRRGNDQRPSVVLINSTTLTKHGQRVQL